LATRSSWNFTLTVDGHVLWDRSEEGGFPDHTELKHRARDRLDPAKKHSDINMPEVVEEKDEDEPAAARNFVEVL
jgi:selenoprotein W-related protein